MNEKTMVFRLIVKMLLRMSLRKLKLIYEFILGATDANDQSSEDEIIPANQRSVIEAIQQLKPINVYRVLVVAETLKSMEQEAAQMKEAQS